MNKLEQSVPGLILVAAGIWLCMVSFTQQPAAAFTFPRLIAVLFIILSIIAVGQSMLSKDKSETSIPIHIWKNILPGLGVAAIYVFWASKTLGFYTAAAITMFILMLIYAPESYKNINNGVKLLVITAGFTTVMYLMFAVLLGVFTPREFWLG